MITLRHDGLGEIFYATTHSSGFDICANEDLILEPSQWALVRTGLKIIDSSGVSEILWKGEKIFCVPEIQIRPRSGLAAKFGLTVLNAPSTIDADYRGEIFVNLINHSKKNYAIKIGDRIAQGVCTMSIQLNCFPVKDKERGSGGFGSTGI